MIEVDLVRVTMMKKAPQFGVLLFDGLPKFLTLEPPDLDNAPYISAIPTGSYVCKHRSSPKTNGWRTFEVMDVPGRSDILFHWGNTVVNTEGCILIGLSLGEVDFKDAILSSRRGWTKFMAMLKDETEFKLFIRHA